MKAFYDILTSLSAMSDARAHAWATDTVGGAMTCQ
jgi:hypothetical protein